MNIEQNAIDPLNAELTIRLNPADYNERFEKALRNYRKQVQMPGFRPGHVPPGLIKKRFGKSLLAEEINQVLQEAISSYLTAQKLQVLGSPLPKPAGESGNWDEPGDFTFIYELGLAPTIDVKLDSSQRFTFYRVDITGELIDRQIKDYTRRYGEMSQPDQSGPEDLLMVRLNELDENGDIKEGGITGKTTLTIEYIKNDELRKNLTGLSLEGTVDANPHDLSDNHEDLAKMLGITHHEVHHLNSRFRATVTDIRRIAPAEINSELLNKLFPEGEVTSEEELRERVRRDLDAMFLRDSEWLFKRDFSREIVKRSEVNLPDQFLKRWISLTSEKPISPSALEHEYPVYADSLRWQLIENEIIRAFDIKVTKEDSQNYVKELLRERFISYGIPLDEERLDEMAKETLRKEEEAKNIYDQLFESRIMDVVKANCTIDEKILPYDEFVNLVQH